MKKIISSALLSSLVSLTASASLVAVVDSGTDFQHEKLAAHAYINEKEVAGNRVDDDRNGKVDDISGWNFAENYGRVFYGEHLQTVNPLTYKLFEIIAHQQAGRATDEEKKFWEQHVTSLPTEEKTNLLAHLNFFGQYAHSTHVTGLVLSQAPTAKILSARVFPDNPPPEYVESGKGIMDYVYQFLAMISSAMFDNVAVYLKETHADVANYSLGMSLQNIAKQMLALRGNAAPTPEQLATETKRVYEQFEKKGRAWMGQSPGTLFVIAAGNDGANNDVIPTFPASVRVENAITVAASLDFVSIAKFSNYGKTSVDVAAPGVAMISTVPSLDRKAVLPMSGTSMASPYVAGIAGQMKEINPNLTPVQMRKILMGTVDYKEWLKEKVVSGGVVNSARAYAACEASKSMDVEAAIASARTSVGDQAVTAPAVRSIMSAPADLMQMANALVF